MPIIEKIVISNFRNIELQEIEFSPNVNCICGNNGEGKTNLLDAVYYLSMTKSAFSSTDKFNFRHGCGEFAISEQCLMENGLRARFSIRVEAQGDKKIKRDEKTYDKISQHVGVLPVVLVSPSDTSLVSESGEERRKFVNGVLSQMSPEYLNNVQQYNRLLAMRNKMLKDMNPDRGLFEAVDVKMSVIGEAVYMARKAFIAELLPVVERYYALLSSDAEKVSIDYVSDLAKGDLADIFASNFEKDSLLRYTGAGIQRDDFIFGMNGWPIRKCGSQGQQKSFLVALKFAQYEIMKKNYGFAPTLLLDDVFDKLDMERISNLLGMVSGNDFGQIFITDSNKVRMSGIVDGLTADRAYFETVGGQYNRL